MSHGDAVTRRPTGSSPPPRSPDAPVAALEHPEPAASSACSSTPRSCTPRTGRHAHEALPLRRVRAVARLDDGELHRRTPSRRSAPRSATAVRSAVSPAASTPRSPRRWCTRRSASQLTCVFVDTGLLRKDEGEQVVETFRRHQGIQLIHVKAARSASSSAWPASPSPEAEAQGRSASCSSGCSRTRGPVSTDAKFLVQGTLYPDVIESGTTHAADDQEPPQRRRPARRPGLRPGRAAAGAVQGRGPAGRRRARPAREIVWRQPFPGPGLGVRIIGEVTPDKVAVLQEADADRARGDPASPGWSARSGSRSPCCPTSAPSGSWATSAPTATP